MLQHTAQPRSNHQIFNPVSTGSPRYDLYNHLSNLPQSARIDFESHSVIGDFIIRIEPDIGTDTEREAEARIVSIPYAERILGNREDAIEFIRCVKLLAGEDARAFNTQIIASHYYKEIRRRAVNEVLKEMGLLAMQLTAVTSTVDERLFDKFVETPGDMDESEIFSPTAYATRSSLTLDEVEEETNLFEIERRAASRFRSHASGFVYEDAFAAYLIEREPSCDSLEELDALYESFESVYEQYDEDHIVSLHMSDGERVVVAGRLDDDIDEETVPEEARHLVRELYDLYTNGFPLIDRCDESNKLSESGEPDAEGVILQSYLRHPRTGERFQSPVAVYGLDAWLSHAVDAVFHERTKRTGRQLISVRRGERSHLHEQTYTIEVCPNADEREQTRNALEILLERWKSDFHTRALHANAAYRDLTSKLGDVTDTATIAGIKKEAWQHKEQGRLSLKLFTGLMTLANARQAALESAPLRERRKRQLASSDSSSAMTEEIPGEAREYIVAQPLLNKIPALTGRTLGDFAMKIHNLPRQEQERVRKAFEAGNPQLYARVRDGLRAELLKSSPGRLRYFRWAFYSNNKPEHPVHALTRKDRSAAWELLKNLSHRNVDLTPTPPLLLIAEQEEKKRAAMI
jgi:hypothetical protein